jgi:hypothetical protein
MSARFLTWFTHELLLSYCNFDTQDLVPREDSISAYLRNPTFLWYYSAESGTSSLVEVMVDVSVMP